MNDVLVRLQKTQCCDPVIDGVLGASIEEIQRLRVALERVLFFTTGVPYNALGWAVNRANEIAYQALGANR